MQPRSLSYSCRLAAAGLVAASFLAAPRAAYAIPAFAAQTGEPCSACHIGFPQLTPYGRAFKLEGYIAGGMFPTYKNFAAMSQIGWTHVQDKVPGGLAPGFKSNDAWAAQQTSLFYGGALDANIGLGAFVQVTYDGIAKAWAWDNTDIRLARPGRLFGDPLYWGVTLNNNPGVTDLWNTPPSWGYPYIPSGLAPAPAAEQQITAIAGGVYGIGLYGALNVTPADMIYAEADFYKSLPNRLSYTLGVGPATQLSGATPYVRLAFQHQWGNSSIEVGTYALMDRPYPDGMSSGMTDQFFDIAADSQFQYISHNQAFSVQANIIHESQSWQASYPLGLVSNRADSLNIVTLTASELWRQQFGLTESFNTIYGNSDPGLYGNANGKPNSNSWTTELDYYPFNDGGPKWLPVLNAKFFLEDTVYPVFDGTSTNASANNTVFAGIWLVF